MQGVIYACTTFGFVRVFFSRGSFLSSRTGACPVTTDLIMRVNVRTTTETGTWCTKARLKMVCCRVPGIFQVNSRWGGKTRHQTTTVMACRLPKSFVSALGAQHRT